MGTATTRATAGPWRSFLAGVLALVALTAPAAAQGAGVDFPPLSGRVVDFLLFYVGPYQWPAFNVADSAIVVGAGLLVIEILFGKSPAPEKSA